MSDQPEPALAPDPFDLAIARCDTLRWAAIELIDYDLAAFWRDNRRFLIDWHVEHLLTIDPASAILVGGGRDQDNQPTT